MRTSRPAWPIRQQTSSPASFSRGDSAEPAPRRTAPEKQQRLKKLRSPNVDGCGEHATGREASPDSPSGHQHDQANRALAQRHPARSLFPGRWRRAGAAAKVVADAQCRYQRGNNRKRCHEDERPSSLSREGHRPDTPRPTNGGRYCARRSHRLRQKRIAVLCQRVLAAVRTATKRRRSGWRSLSGAHPDAADNGCESPRCVPARCLARNAG